MKVIQTKACIQCGTTFPKPYVISTKQWEKQKYCSWPCRAKAVGIANKGRKDTDEVRAKKSRSLQGSLNPQFGIKKPPEVIAKLHAALKEKTAGERHYRWKGDAVGYYSLHKWVNKQHPRTGICEHCGRKPKRTQYANLKEHNYTRNREDFAELCVKCHHALDGRTKDKLGRFTSSSLN